VTGVLVQLDEPGLFSIDGYISSGIAARGGSGDSHERGTEVQN